MKYNYTYDAWGNCTILTDTNGIGALNPFRYRGYYWDSELNLYYLNTRYYDPAICRFISQDSIKYLEPEKLNGLNLFAYCLNNPVMGTDPDGTLSWKGLGMIVAAIVVVAVVACATAITAGVAAAAIAGAFGVATSMTSVIGTAVAVTAATAGTVVGMGEVFNQALIKGAENINLGSVAISTFGGTADGAMIAGSLFTGPLGKVALIAGRVGVSAATTALYGVSEGNDVETIRLNVAVNAGLTFLAGMLTFLPVKNLESAIQFQPIKTALAKGIIQLLKILFSLPEYF